MMWGFHDFWKPEIQMSQAIWMRVLAGYHGKTTSNVLLSFWYDVRRNLHGVFV